MSKFNFAEVIAFACCVILLFLSVKNALTDDLDVAMYQAILAGVDVLLAIWLGRRVL